MGSLASSEQGHCQMPVGGIAATLLPNAKLLPKVMIDILREAPTTGSLVQMQRDSVNVREAQQLTDADRFGFFLRITDADFPGYFRAMRGRNERLEINAAERFTRAWLARNVTARGTVLEGAERFLIAQSLGQSGLNAFALVASATLAISLRQFLDAETLAGGAAAADQHDTYAQRLQLAARERSVSLRLEVDDWLQDRFCDNPFSNVEIIGSRDVYTCCAAWMPAKLGHAEDVADVWNGARAAEVRRSVLDGDFGYCSRLSCPRIAGRELPRRDDSNLAEMLSSKCTGGVVAAPRRVLLSYDESCNLSCPSCRKKLLMANKEATAELDAFYDQHIARLIESASEIKVTGSGDPFGSRHFRKVLGKIAADGKDGPRLQLQTNGLLFDRRAWEELGLAGHVRSVWISVDAATAGTYAKLRGGDFDRLIKNMEMLGELRAEGAFAELRLDFVVQNENFTELEDFVALARRVGADGVHLLRLRNWGTFTPDEFLSHDVSRRDHPNHAALLDILKRPSLSDRFVDLGNLSPLLTTTPTDNRRHTTEVPQIVVFGAARTGTNLLFQLLDLFPKLMIYRELFNPAGSFGMERYGGAPLRLHSDLDRTAYTGERDRRLVASVRNDPLRTLNHLRALAAKRSADAIAFKLFPGQIESAEVLDGVLSDRKLVPIIVRRQPIASFVSLLKARKNDVWTGADTTDIKVPFDFDEFRDWYEIHAHWYRHIGSRLRDLGQSPLVLDYETFSSDLDLIGKELAKHISSLGVNVATQATVNVSLIRQDRTSDVFERFENPSSVRDTLEQFGYIERALEYFEL